MDIRKLQRAIVDGLEDVKAHDIQVFNTEHLSPLFERVIVASGTSNRQTKALASSVRDAVKAAGLDVLRTEGEENGEWIIVDCGAAVAHIMQPAIRQYYHLEEIWGERPVRLKFGAPKPAMPSEPMDAPARKTTGKTPGGKTPAKKTPARTAGKTAAKSASSGASRGAPRSAPPAAKKATAKKSPAQTAAKKSTAPRAGSRTAAKRTPAKKSPTRRK